MNSRRKFANGEELHTLFREVFALQRALAMRMDAIHESAGLGTPQVKVMDALMRHGSATVPEVAADQGVSRQFVQTVCNALFDRGLIDFADNPRHRRSKLASLSAAGRQALATFRRAEAKEIGGKLPRFEAVDVAAATALLRKIHDDVESE